MYKSTWKDFWVDKHKQEKQEEQVWRWAGNELSAIFCAQTEATLPLGIRWRSHTAREAPQLLSASVSVSDGDSCGFKWNLKQTDSMQTFGL